mgnify:CR=1 FL=1
MNGVAERRGDVVWQVAARKGKAGEYVVEIVVEAMSERRTA